MVVDGDEGRVYIQPSPGLLTIFQRRIREAGLRAERLAAMRELPAETLDGTRVPLYANIGLPSDIASAAVSGAEGIGLYRTEYSFLLSDTLPDEDDQCASYREVPASVHLAEILIQRVDFLSIGTNDLTQYMLAVDRNNAQVVTPYDGLHPAVLNAIHQVIETAHRQGKPVSVCGEMAGDPAGALLLLGMGADTLSISPALLDLVKFAIRCFTRRRARLLADTALGMDDGFSIHRLMNGALEENRGCPEAGGAPLD